MTKPYVPFQSFEKSCSNASKPLAESMQENCKERLAPDVPELCSAKPCPSYWQASGEIRCLPSGLVDIEELDGCGNSRWTRSVDVVIWTDVELQNCVDNLDAEEGIYMQQINQCGGTRKVFTGNYCCEPEWVNAGGEPTYNCDQSGLRVEQEDGCENTRLKYMGRPVDWMSTGEERCEPGNIYQVEQLSECGTTRWYTIGVGCPCIPEWTNTANQRCTGSFIENEQASGCGTTRWQATETAVIWSNTGTTRCSAGIRQNQQISQCGTTRWFSTEETCLNSPNANEIAQIYADAVISGSGRKFMSCKLNAANGLISWGHGNNSGFVDQSSAFWVTGAYDRNHYEARISYTSGENDGGFYTGSAVNMWFDLGDTTEVTGTFTCTQPGFPMESASIVEWHNILIRIDIRKKGEGISGGAGWGAFKLRAD